MRKPKKEESVTQKNFKICVICDRPHKAKTETCNTCNRKKKALNQKLKDKGINYKHGFSNSKIVYLKQIYKVDDIIVDGIDVYNKDEKYSINAEIYEIKNVYKDCAYAIKFEGDKEYYSYLNTTYEFETLGDFIEKLNLEEYLQFGTATYKNNIVYKDFDDSIVWDMLLSDYSLTNTSLTNNNYKNPLMSINTNIEALGIKNVSFAVNDEGYIQTNILGTAKTFYIGEEKVNNFIDYIIKNIPKKNLF